MKVLLTGELGVGGAETQLTKTAQALKKLGVDLSISDEDGFDGSDFDLVHVFNSHAPKRTARRMECAKKADLPILFSTIFWNQHELMLEWERRGWRNRREQERDWNQRLGQLRPIFEAADVWLPNSYSEYGVVGASFNLWRPFRVVWNAVDPDFADLPMVNDVPESDVLMVGRWELRKNQAALFEGLRELSNMQILVIGGTNKYDREHYAASVDFALAHGNVRIMDETDDPAIISSLMRKTKVLVQPSFYETPGLAALEAGLCGAALVVGERGSTREYFDHRAHYCNPREPESIRRAVEKAIEEGPPADLAEWIAERYNWETAARQTLRAYKDVLEK